MIYSDRSKSQQQHIYFQSQIRKQRLLKQLTEYADSINEFNSKRSVMKKRPIYLLKSNAFANNMVDNLGKDYLYVNRLNQFNEILKNFNSNEAVNQLLQSNQTRATEKSSNSQTDRSEFKTNTNHFRNPTKFQRSERSQSYQNNTKVIHYDEQLMTHPLFTLEDQQYDRPKQKSRQSIRMKTEYSNQNFQETRNPKSQIKTQPTLSDYNQTYIYAYEKEQLRKMDLLFDESSQISSDFIRISNQIAKIGKSPPKSTFKSYLYEQSLDTKQTLGMNYLKKQRQMSKRPPTHIRLSKEFPYSNKLYVIV